MNDVFLLAQRVCDDPGLASARSAALAAARVEWNETHSALRANNHKELTHQLRRSAHDQAAVDYASMHARVCPDCPEIESILAAGGAALARQALSWYGVLGSLGQRSNGPQPVDLLTRWLSSSEPALLARLPAELDALAGT